MIFARFNYKYHVWIYLFTEISEHEFNGENIIKIDNFVLNG